MKNKKLLLGIGIVIIVIVAITIGIVILIPKNISTNEPLEEKKNPYGFISEYSESSNEEYQLKNYPEIKDKMLELEKIILENNLKIKKIKFDNYGLTSFFYLGDSDNSNDYIKLDIDKDSQTGEYKFYSLETRIFDDTKYEASKKAIVSFAKLSEDEAKIVDNITKEDSVQTMIYSISYSEGTEKVYTNNIKEEVAKAEELPYKKLEIKNYPAKDERQTTLYSVKREERKPKAEGINIDVYGLSFYVPKELKANTYNGTFYVWEYYTGNYVGSYPNGIDVTLRVNGLSEGKDIDTYIRNDSRPARSSNVTPFEIKEINGAKWYTCNNGTIYYYGAEFMGNVYQIEVKNGKVIDGVTLESVMNMIEKTLFFE